jgi:hypothetical protein
MSTITDFTSLSKADFEALRSDINAALSEVGQKYGISFAAGNVSFRSNTATIKLECAIGTSDDGVDPSMAKYAQAFETYKFLFPNLNLTDTYVIRGKAYKIGGYNRRAREYPLILISQKTGQAYKFDVETVKNARVKK